MAKVAKKEYITSIVGKRAMEHYLMGLTIIVMVASGCAHTQKQAASSPPAMAASGVSVSSAPVPLDSLPYTFTRHGVEIRVYSIELNPEGQLGVNIKLLETRGAAHEVTPSTLFQVQTSSGE